MGEYAKKLNVYEYDEWVRRVRKAMIDKDISPLDLASMTGYSIKTVYDSLRDYDRCSRFFVATVCERLGV
jgi:hypothetical protein